MNKAVSYRWLLGAFIALFFALQSYTLSHASAYGEAPHEHDEIACSVTVVSDDVATITPAAPVTQTTISNISEPVYPDFTSILYLTPQGRAPPPRGPPASI